MTIIRNAAKCLICNEVVESTYRHDFKQCSCGNVTVDGGRDYMRRGIRDMTKYEDLTESTNED